MKNVECRIINYSFLILHSKSFILNSSFYIINSKIWGRYFEIAAPFFLESIRLKSMSPVRARHI